jgi:hypothetical protein
LPNSFPLISGEFVFATTNGFCRVMDVVPTQ